MHIILIVRLRIYTVFNFRLNPYKKLIQWHFLTFLTGWLIGNPSVRVYTFSSANNVLQPFTQIFYKAIDAFIPDTIATNKKGRLGSNHFGVFNETLLVPECPNHAFGYLVIGFFNLAKMRGLNLTLVRGREKGVFI